MTPAGPWPRHFWADIPLIQTTDRSFGGRMLWLGWVVCGCWHFGHVLWLSEAPEAGLFGGASAAANRTACVGGVTPCSAAQAIFSRMVWQQHAPAQH